MVLTENIERLNHNEKLEEAKSKLSEFESPENPDAVKDEMDELACSLVVCNNV